MSVEISIIVPIYNKENYLENCIESLLGQTFENIEVLLIDDGSNDLSYEVCQKYQSKSSKIRIFTKTNGGVSSARNLGLAKCTGRFVTFVDPDDYLEPDALEYLYNLINVYDADVVGYKMNIYKDGISSIYNNEEEKIEIYKDSDIIKEYVNTGKFLYSACNKLFRKQLIIDNNIMFLEDIHYAEDAVFNYYVLSKAKTLVFSNLRKYNYFINEVSTVSNVSSKRIDILKAQVKIYTLLNESFPDYKNYIIKDYVYSAILIALDIARENTIFQKKNILLELKFYLKNNKGIFSKHELKCINIKNKIFFMFLTKSPLLFSFLYRMKILLFERKKNRF